MPCTGGGAIPKITRATFTPAGPDQGLRASYFGARGQAIVVDHVAEPVFATI